MELSLTDDHDPQLHELTEHISKEIFPRAKGWNRLGYLLTKLGQFDKAQQGYEIMLYETRTDHARAFIYHMLGIIKDAQGEYEEAITFFETSIEIHQKTLSLQLLPKYLAPITASQICIKKRWVLKSTFMLWKSYRNLPKNYSSKSFEFGYFL